MNEIYEPPKYPLFDIVEYFERFGRLAGEPIKLYPWQKALVQDKSQFRIINKARQIGISTAMAAESIYETIWFPNKTILLVSTGERTSKELMDNAKMILQPLEKVTMQFRFNGNIYTFSTKDVANSKTFLQFENNSRVMALPNNPNNIRGFKADHVKIDEMAHFDNSKEIWEALLPATTRGGRVTLVSTPKGKIGEYYRIWDESIRKMNEFKRFEFPLEGKKIIEKKYVRIPITDSQLRQQIMDKKRDMTEDQFKQEYCSIFIDETVSYFPYELLNPTIKDDLEVWMDMRTVNPVYIGIDIGAKRSSTVIVIVEQAKDKWIIRPPIKEFYGEERKEGETAPWDFSQQLRFLNNMITSIRPTRVFIDEGGHGMQLRQELQRTCGGVIQGVQFTNPLKEKMITNLRILFENQAIEIPRNNSLVDQLHSLEKTVTAGGYSKYKHGSGKFDDYVWALALAVSPEERKNQNFSVVRIR